MARYAGFIALFMALSVAQALAQSVPLPTPRPNAFSKVTPAPPPSAAEPHPQEFGGGLNHEQFRVRMRGCAVQWARLQRETPKSDVLWRDFANVCLRQDPAG